VLGCVAYCHIPESKRNKFDLRAIPSILVGYEEGNKAYRCWDPVSRKILISRDIRFDEGNFDPKISFKSKPLEDQFLDNVPTGIPLGDRILPNIPKSFYLPESSSPTPLQPLIPRESSPPVPIPLPQPGI
jgi:hypothetical protein